MRINREEWLRTLEGVSPGLAAKEVSEQATCFAFQGGTVYTFNGEVACRAPCHTSLKGAVPAQKLLDLLRKMTEEGLDVDSKPEEILIKGQGRRATLRLEAEVTMPINALEVPDKWLTLDPDVLEAIELAAECAAPTSDNFALMCLHFTPDYVEACDNYQALRYKVATGVQGNAMVKHDAARHLVGCGMTEMRQTLNWLHFRNPVGLTISCRQYHETYPPIDKFYAQSGTPARLPLGLVEAVWKAAIFAEGPDVRFDLRPGKMRVMCRSVDGSYEEQREVQYTGEPVGFLMSAKLTESILKHSQDVLVCPGAVKVELPKFTFITSSRVPEDEPKAE